MNVNFFSSCFWVLIVLFTPAQAEDRVAIVDEADISWVGEYSNVSGYCIYVGTGEGCSDDFRDTLKIKRNPSGYFVELYSTQAGQHVCSFAFDMVVEGQALVYRSEFGVVRVEKKNGRLKVSSGGIDPTALGLGVCGAHADIDGLEYPIASRVLHD